MNPAPIVISAFGIPWALLATFKLAPTFLGMFADFGSELPKLTQLMVTPWAPLALAFAGLAVVAATAQVLEELGSPRRRDHHDPAAAGDLRDGDVPADLLDRRPYSVTRQSTCATLFRSSRKPSTASAI